MITDHFSLAEKRKLLALARKTIERLVNGEKKEYLSEPKPAFNLLRGVFVTLHIENDLRGCMGYPMPEIPLCQGITDYAIAAASMDPRFYPVQKDELARIIIEISILTVPQQVFSLDDIKVGRDGIIITKGMNRGLLLPQVSVEQQWDLEEYLSHGCLKAGLEKDEWQRGVKIETFQAIIFSEKELNHP